VTSTDCKPIESAKCVKLSMPERRDGALPGEIIQCGVGSDLGNVDVSHSLAKGLQDNGFRSKTHAHGLFNGYVVGSELDKFHDSPPKSTSATNRNSGRFTLA
jgi:hypothetical protein